MSSLIKNNELNWNILPNKPSREYKINWYIYIFLKIINKNVTDSIDIPEYFTKFYEPYLDCSKVDETNAPVMSEIM